jgi:predicted kinase
VRAKVAAINIEQHPENAETILKDLQRYLDLAESFLSQPAEPHIILMHGVSGSGKTQLAKQLADNTNAIHIRSDVERKRLLGLNPQESTDKQSETAYSPQLSHLTYQRLMALSYAITDAGFSVIVDATFIKHENRIAYERLAKVAGIPLNILSLTAPTEVLTTRVNQRAIQGNDASEATAKVLEVQLEQETELTENEQALAIYIDTSQDIDIDSIITKLGITN